MPLIQLIVYLIIVGLLLWLVGFLPIDAKIQQIIRGIVIVAVVLWLILYLVPMLGGGPWIGAPRHHGIKFGAPGPESTAASPRNLPSPEHWRTGWESNPQPLCLEQSALPVELPERKLDNFSELHVANRVAGLLQLL